MVLLMEDRKLEMTERNPETREIVTVLATEVLNPKSNARWESLRDAGAVAGDPGGLRQQT